MLVTLHDMKITRTTNLSKGHTGLNIPVITPEHVARLDFALPIFTKWCDSLPLADTATTAKMLFLALTELNKTSLKPEDKFAIAEMIRRPLYSTTVGLRKHYINHSNSLAKQKLMVAELAQTLQTEITHIYKTIFEEITNGKSSFDPKYNRIIEVSLYRIIYFFLRRLFRSYQLYNQIEPGLWREIHLIYHIACQLKTQKNAIGTQYTVENFPVTVENCYKEILILAATNPYQWRHLEQEAIMAALNYWVDHAIIRQFNNDFKSRGVYLFNPTKDSGPISPQLSQDSIDTQSLILELNEQAAKTSLISERIEFSAQDGSEYSLSLACFNKLIHDWTKEVKPKDLRVLTTGSTRATFGINATYYNINNRKKSDLKKEIHTNLNYLQADEEENKPESKIVGEVFPVHICFMHDQSPGGYQIMHYSEVHPIIHAGDIVGLKKVKPNQDPSTWEIGEIRWLQYRSAEKLSIGIRKLSNNPLPVNVYLLRNDQSRQDTLFHCILLGETPQIITPMLPFKQGQKILLEKTLTNKIIVLEKQISTSGTFKIFEYKEMVANNDHQEKNSDVADKDAPKANSFDPQKVATEFDDIWHTL
jgi:hypothetical protein